MGPDSGAIPHVIGQGGLIFPEGNVPALAAAIQSIRGDKNAAREMGLAGRRRVEASFTWRHVAEKFRDTYLAATRCSSPEGWERHPASDYSQGGLRCFKQDTLDLAYGPRLMELDEAAILPAPAPDCWCRWAMSLRWPTPFVDCLRSRKKPGNGPARAAAAC